jgi:hypothetical protein
MAGYLDHYGEGDVRRAKQIKLLISVALIILLVGAGVYIILKDRREKAQVNHFFALLKAHDYKTAYALWGCTDAKPCRDYGFDKFLEDWGPQSRYADVTAAKITKSRDCGTGVIITTDLGSQRIERLWVERSDETIGFSPWPVCPHK